MLMFDDNWEVNKTKKGAKQKQTNKTKQKFKLFWGQWNTYGEN